MMTGPKVILGEPGMGKSELINEIGRQLGVLPVTAVRFMLSRNPVGFVVANKPLLIDGLDEAIARREGDAVDMILAQLEEVGTSNFILSCRSREWQSRNVTNLRQILGAEPAIYSLEALSRNEANAFLMQCYAKADSEHVLSHLEEHGIADLYSNPLTLGLMGQVAEHDAKLPSTRAALFERVCTLIWPEHDPDRQDSGLGKITEDQALSAAGALMAGLLFAGADAVSLAGPGQIQDGDVRLSDLSTLPGANAARAIFSSKLFHSVGIGRAKPIHRVIAEFLGARWLAHQATTTRTQRRLLAQLHGSGAVPASLRGLHAWLAFHCLKMAKSIIAADPFGVLRYGETASLTAEQADCMFDALQVLAEVDPYFRAQDWDNHTASGLMIPSLRTKIEMIISCGSGNSHLRSLLIEGLKGTSLAGDLAEMLVIVMLSEERSYHEREAAAEALMPHRNHAWFQEIISKLHDQGTEDSTRLAHSLITQIDCDVSDDLLVATLLAEMGVTICPLPYVKKHRVHTLRYYGLIIATLPKDRLVNVLNLLSDHAQFVKHAERRAANDLEKLVSTLIVRAIDEEVVLPADAMLLWNWLGVLQSATYSPRNELQALYTKLDTHDDLRHAVQEHVIYKICLRPSIYLMEFDLQRRMVGLSSRPRDVIWFLERLAGANNKATTQRNEWCDLMRLGIRHDGFDPELRAASLKFQAGDQQLEAFVHKLENPKKPAWKYREERLTAKRERKRRVANEIARRQYTARKSALRAGELWDIIYPAKAYLGLLPELTLERPPSDRIAEWLGDELAAYSMAGFEAVLHRNDIPSSIEVSRGFAEGKTYSYGYAIMAGLWSRLRSSSDFSNISADVLKTGLLLCHNDRGLSNDSDLPMLCEALEQKLILTTKDREDFARLWVEPSLATKALNPSGLYKLAHDEHWQETGSVLAPEWLMTFPDLPEHIELELVDCIANSGLLTSLVSIAATRDSMVFRNEESLFTWLAIDVLVRFDKVLPDIAGIGTEHPDFIWYLRNRFQLRRHGALFPVSIAQAKWIISEFRAAWPYAILEGSGSGDTNPYDATDFLLAMISRIANNTCEEACEAMHELIFQPADSYSALIRHMAAEQRQKRVEENLEPLLPQDLGHLLAEGPPSNANDLKSLVLEELTVAQKILIGDDVDQVRDFWNDSGVPHDENRCRDRLAAMIGPELMRYNIQRITEADMPKTKRADLAFACGQLQLPMEVKGQWHTEVWQAATDQLDLKYLIDWRSEQRGIYCVFWCGDLPSTSGRRLQAPPQGLEAPKSADEMCKMLIERIPEARRALIDVIVIDLTAGKP